MKSTPWLRFRSTDQLLEDRAAIRKVTARIRSERDSAPHYGRGAWLDHQRDHLMYVGLLAQVTRLLRDRGADPEYDAAPHRANVREMERRYNRAW